MIIDSTACRVQGESSGSAGEISLSKRLTTVGTGKPTSLLTLLIPPNLLTPLFLSLSASDNVAIIRKALAVSCKLCGLLFWLG
jgi:hypothetical protein